MGPCAGTAPPLARGTPMTMKSHSPGLLDRTFPYWSLLPAVIVFVVLSLYPMLNLIIMSTSVYRFENGAESPSFAPMQNFSYFAGDAVLKAAIVNTIVFVVVAVSAEMAIGLALAIYASRISEWKGCIRTLILLPILVPPVAIGSMWQLMYNYDFGVFNQALSVAWARQLAGRHTLSLLSIIIVDVWHWVPFIFLDPVRRGRRLAGRRDRGRARRRREAGAGDALPSCCRS